MNELCEQCGKRQTSDLWYPFCGLVCYEPWRWEADDRMKLTFEQGKAYTVDELYAILQSLRLQGFGEETIYTSPRSDGICTVVRVVSAGYV